MYLFAALVLCALPSALGAVSCYECMPNETYWCNMLDDSMMKQCTKDNSSCYNTTIMVANVTTYTLGCLEMATCEEQNTTTCNLAETVATNNNQTLAMCETACTPGNPVPTTMTTMMTSTVATTTDSAAAIEKLCPAFLGVLSIILFTILRQ